MLNKFIAVLFVASLAFCGKTDWYKNSVFYQVYPRSFRDSNNDGVGDIMGIYEKLDHLKDAGITVAWLSPVFKSPQIDHGYDISDYYSIDPIYGNLNDLTLLIGKAERLGIKIVLDLVPNHTSNQHYWFDMSINRVPGYEDYYVWVDPRIDKYGNKLPPNNWISVFQNSSWSWNEKRQQYYLHQFDPLQPDLNLRNEKLKDELKRILAFYFRLGISGFRIDAAPYLLEDKELRDEPPVNVSDMYPTSWESFSHIYTKDTDETYDIIYEFRSFVDSYSERHDGDARIIMTEAYTDFNKTLFYFGNTDASRLGAHFTFNFELADMRYIPNANDIKEIIERWIKSLNNEYPHNWVLGSHDNHRISTRLGNIDGYNMLITFLPGIAAFYYGEEIGQENGEVKCEEGTDPKTINNCDTFPFVSRDYQRTPFQWDTTTNAGFNDGAKPWLPVSKKYKETNLLAQNIPGLRSHYNIFKNMTKLRKRLSKYDEMFIDSNSATKNVLHITRYLRGGKEEAYVLLFNMDKLENKSVYIGIKRYEVIVSSVNSNYIKGDIFKNNFLSLLPHESLIIKELSPANCFAP